MTDLNPHRPAWLSWMPAVVLTVLIGVAVYIAIAVVPPLAFGPPPAEPGQVDDRNFSVFTEEGLEFVDAERLPRIDLRDAPVDAEALGLPANGVLTVGPHPLGLDYRLVLLITGDDPQGARFLAESFTLETDDGALTRIEVVPARTVQATGPFRQAHELLVSEGQRFGFDAPSIDDVIQQVIDAQQAEAPVTVITQTGDATGVPVGAEFTCAASGLCSITFFVVPAVG